MPEVNESEEKPRVVLIPVPQSMPAQYLANFNHRCYVTEKAMEFVGEIINSRPKMIIHDEGGNEQVKVMEGFACEEEGAAFKAACDHLYSIFHRGYLIDPLPLTGMPQIEGKSDSTEG